MGKDETGEIYKTGYKMSDNFIRLSIPEGKAFDRIETDDDGNIDVVLKDAGVALGPYQPETEPGYWFVNSVHSLGYMEWDNSSIDNAYCDNFNTYANRDHAETDAAYLFAIRKLRRFAHQLNPEGWAWRGKPTDEQVKGWQIDYKYGELRLLSGVWVGTLGAPLFHSREAAQQAIDALTPEDIAALQTQY